jgi:Flp pilus assembly protein TadG
MHRLFARSDRAKSRGQSLVELALIGPVLLLLLLTALDMGRLLYSQITVTNAAKEGALVASQGGTFQDGQPCADDNTVMCGVLTEAEGGFVEVDRTRVALAPAACDKNGTYPTSGAPPDVAVTVEAPFQLLTPIIGSIVGSNLTLSSTAEAQCLVVPKVTFPSLPAPVAQFTASPLSGPAPLLVNVDGSASTATGATIVSYSWSFGGSGVTASKNYTSAGTYQITLTVTDSRGQSDTSDPATVTVGTGGPSCPTVSFVATPDANRGNPHRMDLAGSLSDSTTAGSWAWSGAITASGRTVNNIDFPSTGPHSVTLSWTNTSCSASVTQTVMAP